MKTWRERLAAAEQHGWTRGDVFQWLSVETCPAAEVAGQYGATYTDRRYRELWVLGDSMGEVTGVGTGTLCPPRVFAKKLDQLEERALQLKREQA